MKEYTTLGKKFGDLVVTGDFDKAYEFFSEDLKDSISREDLISSYEEMVEYFSDEGPCSINAWAFSYNRSW